MCLIYLESDQAHFALSSLSIARGGAQGKRGGLIKWVLITRQWMPAFLSHFPLAAKSGVWFLIMWIADWASSHLPPKPEGPNVKSWESMFDKVPYRSSTFHQRPVLVEALIRVLDGLALFPRLRLYFSVTIRQSSNFRHDNQWVFNPAVGSEARFFKFSWIEINKMSFERLCFCMDTHKYRDQDALYVLCLPEVYN